MPTIFVIPPENENATNCLHCGKPVTETISELVEIDDDDYEHAIGVVHPECLRPIDRILGYVRTTLFEEFDFLHKFDVEKWAKLIQHGQGVFNSLRENPAFKTQVITIGWDNPTEYDPSYKYCVKIQLADGSTRYVTSRGKVERMPEKQALETAEFMDENIIRARENKDPFCYTSNTGNFGQYSLLTRFMSDDDECIECLSTEVTLYNTLIGKIHNDNIDFYAPVCILVDENTEEIFSIDDHVIMISDPFELEKYLRNWEKADLSPKPYEIVIIEHDYDFDARVRGLLDQGKQIIIDPMISLGQEFLQGMTVVDVRKMTPSSLHHLL